MVFGLGKVKLEDARKTVSKYGLKIEIALIRTPDGEYELDYNAYSFDRMISHVSLNVSREEMEDFISGKTNVIAKKE